MDRFEPVAHGELELHPAEPFWIWASYVLFAIASVATFGVPLAVIALLGPAAGEHHHELAIWPEVMGLLAPAAIGWVVWAIAAERAARRGRVSWNRWGLYEWQRGEVRTAIAWDAARAELDVSRGGAIVSARVFDEHGRCISLLTHASTRHEWDVPRPSRVSELDALAERLRALPTGIATPDTRDLMRPAAPWMQSRVVLPMVSLLSVMCACVPLAWPLFGIALTGALALTTVPALVELTRLVRASWSVRDARRLHLVRREGALLFATDDDGREVRLDANGWSASDASLALRPRGCVFACLGAEAPQSGPYRDAIGGSCRASAIETASDRRARQSRLLVVSLEAAARLTLLAGALFVGALLLWWTVQLT